MKLLLQILWGWSVLANGAVGIQVGTVQTNNQNIKLMKMNFTSPVWLQSASNVGGGTPETRFVFVDGENQVRLSANGSVVIKSVQDGEIVLEEYSALNNTAVTINTDADTEVVIYGAVAEFSTYPQYPPRNVLKSLDVSKNTALTYLFCFGSTGLTSLDVSKNTALTYLNCSGTGLTSLDVSQNTALSTLLCSDLTGLTSLDVSKNTALTALYCSGCTGLTSLDVSQNTALNSLDCSGTGLTSLDVSRNTALSTLLCSDLTDLTSLDVSQNTALNSLDCSGTGLTSLDVSRNTALSTLLCSDLTDLTSLDVSQNTALNSLDCSGCTGMMLLNIQNTTRLEFVELFSSTNTNLTTLQVAGTSAMAYEKVENWLNGDAPNGGTVLVDENTPQEVIDAATAKNWTVEYVDA